MVTETELRLDDGRILHVYDTGTGAGDRRPVVIWHHGTPNIGAPPAPLFGVSDRLGLRWVSYDRPGYGGSTPAAGRTVGSAAGDVAQLADALGLGQFSVMGHSGGGPHALACAALLPGRVRAAVSVAGLAPYGAPGLDWFAGMAPTGVASLQAAAAGRPTKEAYEASEPPFDPEMFTPADHAALAGDWAWLMQVVEPAMQAGPAPLIDDDLAYVTPWGFDPGQLLCPVLLLHGEQDRVVPSAHSRWLARQLPRAALQLRPEDGHLSVLSSGPAALEWLVRASA
ncbi:alpha/beta fold hydrolase [Deinococcus hohokamensis]|uniref:Alpha/beta fold hydrolase n=1 Tax=Deinococcus hohokamensis TaxID=309883 RepID=A0ABV9IBH6_9DEIO